MKLIKMSVFILLTIMLNEIAFSQNVGINNDGSQPDNRAILDVKANNKGVLLPRLSDTERNALYQNVPNGMIIINTSSNQIQIFFDNVWYPVIMGTGIYAPAPPGAPAAVTYAASDFTQTTATLNGSVNPNDATTTVTFDYGLTTEYGNTATAAQSPVSGNTNTAVSAGVDGLTEGAVYHFRVKAVNAEGTSYGDDLTFTAGVTDADGNVYTSIQINTQEWLVENLKTTKYNDGTPIATSWGTNPSYAWFNNDINNKIPYGALYNWYAVDGTSNGGKNICPVGWHVPTYTELTSLTNYLGGESVAGGKMKETGITNWNSPNDGATNESGFTGLPGGHRSDDGSFGNFHLAGQHWTSTQQDSSNAWRYNLYYHQIFCSHGYDSKVQGFSVRCLKD